MLSCEDGKNRKGSNVNGRSERFRATNQTVAPPDSPRSVATSQLPLPSYRGCEQAAGQADLAVVASTQVCEGRE